MKIIIIVLSILVLIKLIVLQFAGLIFTMFYILRRNLKINEKGYGWILEYRKGKPFNLCLFLSYIIDIIIFYIIGGAWFEFIKVSYGGLILLAIIILFTIIGVNKMKTSKKILKYGFNEVDKEDDVDSIYK